MQEAEPAVTILVSPQTVCDWKILGYRIERLVDTAVKMLEIEPTPKIAIRFVPGNWGFLADKEKENADQDEFPISIVNGFSSLPQPDCSIGVVGGRGGETLGGGVSSLSPIKLCNISGF